ncbi:uncharacterized protein LOC135848082 [Planococcus citri]|uniref:uncharacterized protein LOC135848082 n=1 Tax=Planococcus citri TaxID=170843 RepID=UPI0031F83A7B
MLVRSSGVLYSDVMKFCAISNKSVLISGLVIVALLTGLRTTRADDDSSSSSSTEEKGVPIIRQINKVNDDGTYTYGYEAADGSFKIETRDVLGNVKGMFGFIDESGELKRVSYTANNETGFKNSMLHPPTSTPYSTARPIGSQHHHQSGGEPGRRPVLILKNVPLVHGSTKGPVIQHIPKKAKEEEDEAVGINGRRFPANDTQSTSSSSSGEDRGADEGKSSHTNGVANPLRKVLVSKRPVEDKDIKGKGGNSLRRQLSRGGFDLRGEMSHIYAGGGLPPHLDALMSELRPIQVVRTASPESIGYQTVDVEAVPQEINEISTTTEVPAYGTRKYVHPSGPPGYISRYRPAAAAGRHHVAVSEETQQYLQEVTPRQAPPLPPHQLPQQGLPAVPQTLPYALNVPFGGQASPNYQMQPHYYDQPLPYSIPPNLRDELMAIIYNYLQVRLGPLGQQGYYPHPGAYPRSPYPPGPYPYNSPLVNPAAYSNPYPYINPYLPQQYYPYGPNPAAGIYPVPSQTPYAGPNVQFSPRQELPHHRRIAQNRLPTRSAAAADDADLLQMLLASPTRMPISQLKYSPTTERSLGSSRVTQPIRNLQIITETTESRPVTTETPER